jgi:hypothetical protein
MEAYIENLNAGGFCSKPIERAAGRCCSEAFHVTGTLMFAFNLISNCSVPIGFGFHAVTNPMHSQNQHN